MAKSKRRLLSIVGIVAGVLTLVLRKRGLRRAESEPESDPTEEGHDDPETATEHAAVAAEHARLAAEKAAKKRGES